MGSRLLKRWLLAPLRCQKTVQIRQNVIKFLQTNDKISTLHPLLKQVGDMERILARVALCSARPRDLMRLRMGLEVIPMIQHTVSNIPFEQKNVLLHFEKLHDLLNRALAEELPALIRDGGVFAAGYDAMLDELRNIQQHAEQFVIDLEAQEKSRTGLSSLKVNFNKIHGFYIEISRVQAQQAPKEYERRQTLKNAERFTIPVLKNFEEKVLSSQERALAREKKLYENLLQACLEELSALQRLSQALSQLDVLNNLAERAQHLNWHCPLFSKKISLILKLDDIPLLKQI